MNEKSSLVDACYLDRDRFRGEEVSDASEMDVAVPSGRHSPLMIQPAHTCSVARIVPIGRRISACGARKRAGVHRRWVHDMAGFDIDALMRADEDEMRIWRGPMLMGQPRHEADDAIAAGAT